MTERVVCDDGFWAWRELARTRAQWWASGECARAHSEARAKGRGNVAKEFAAAGAAAVIADGIGGGGAHPLAARFTLLIDALHSEARQILHDVPSVVACPERRVAGAR